MEKLLVKVKSGLYPCCFGWDRSSGRICILQVGAGPLQGGSRTWTQNHLRSDIKHFINIKPLGINNKAILSPPGDWTSGFAYADV